MIFDLFSLLVVVAVFAGLILAARPDLLRRSQRPLRRVDHARPRAFAQSGGFAPGELRPTLRRIEPASPGSEGVPQSARPTRRTIAESRAAGEDALVRGPGLAAQPTAEEQPRITRRPAMAPVRASSERARGIRQQLADPRAVRTAFVLREVLDPPVSLRD